MEENNESSGYNDLFSSYMSMLEGSSGSGRSERQTSTVDEEVEEYLSGLGGGSDGGSGESESIYDFSILDRMEENLNMQLGELEERMQFASYSNSSQGQANNINKYDYNAPTSGVSNGKQGAYNAGNIRNSDGSFASYSSPEEGFNALVNQLEKYKTGRTKTKVRPHFTLYEAMSVYAPAADKNDPRGYANFIAKKLGISANTPISQINTTDWAKAVSIMEGNSSYLKSKKKQYGGSIQKYAEGGDTDDYGSTDLFKTYIDALTSSTSQENISAPQGEGQELIEEEKVNTVDKEEQEYLKDLEKTNFNSRLSEIEESYTSKISELSDQIFMLEMYGGQDNEMAKIKKYDYGSTGSTDDGSSGPSYVPNAVPTDKLNFTATGESGLKNVSPIAAKIGNEIADMVGYKPAYTSIFRTRAHQDRLIKQGLPAAKNSKHLTGEAVDIKPEIWNKLTKPQEKYLRSTYKVIFHNNHYHVEPK